MLVLAQREIQTASFRIWTRVTVSIFYDSKQYTKCFHKSWFWYIFFSSGVQYTLFKSLVLSLCLFLHVLLVKRYEMIVSQVDWAVQYTDCISAER